MYLVEDVRLATPTQMAALARKHKFMEDIRREALRVAPVSIGKIVDTVPNCKTSVCSIENATAPDIALSKQRIAGLASATGRIIMRVCGDAYGVNVEGIKSRVRTRRFCDARQASYYVAHEITDWSLPKIGRYFGMRDHTTVLHGLRKVERRIAKEPEYAATIGQLIAAARAQLQEDDLAPAIPGERQRNVSEQQGEREGAHPVS